MTKIESAWGKYPDYEINLVPCGATARVWHGDVLLAESDACLRVEETKHVDRLYFPEADVNWELFAPNDHHTICPFKGEADLLVAHRDRPRREEHGVDVPPARSTRWRASRATSRFYQERVRIELEERVAR